MILDPEQPFVDKAQRLSSWGHWFTFFNILFALLISSSYIVTDAPPSTLFGYAYLITNWLGHTAFITFMLFVLTIFPLSLIFPYPRHIRGMAALVATLSMQLFAIDAYSYSRLGYHISSETLESVLLLLSNTWYSHPLRSLAWLLGISSLIFGYELYISNYSWKRLERLKMRGYGPALAIFFLIAFVSSHVIHIWADAKFNYDVTKQNNMLPFSYPATAKTMLAKNGLLDKNQFQQAQANQLALKQNLEYAVKHQALQCDINAIDRDLSVLVSDSELTEETINQLTELGLLHYEKHYIPSDQEDAMFNLLFGLPANYKDSIVANRQLPLWYQLAQDHNINVSLDSTPSFAPFEYIVAEQLTTQSSNTISFKELEQQQIVTAIKANLNNNYIVIGKAQNKPEALVKTAMLVKWDGLPRYSRQVSQNLGINLAIVESWMHCKTEQGHSPDIFGKNILLNQPKLLAANYTAGTIVSIIKDRIILLDEQGNDLQISAINGYQLHQPLDIPLLIDTINLLKSVSKSNEKR